MIGAQTMMLMFMALELLSGNEIPSAGQPPRCDGATCDEMRAFEVDYSVCPELIPGYELDASKAGSITALGVTEPPSSFLVLMSVQAATQLGFPTLPVENELGPQNGKIQVVDGQIFANEHLLPKSAREYLTTQCRRFEVTRG